MVWLILARAKGVGRVRLAQLMSACPDPADAWRLTEADLVQLEGWTSRVALNLVAARRDPAVRRAAEEEWERAQRSGLRLIALPDPDYPVRLRLTPDPPPFFYQRGPWQPDARPVVALVGTRKPTAYGLTVADRLAADLARMGAVVVSGMARGIDCAAHRGALREGGTTIAVLGGGADVCYPREASRIYRRICESGAVISEQAPGTPPLREHFPERNRIISGLTEAVVVVEAGEKSGTLITVDQALNQGREVLAVPGPITSPLSVGPHRLIRQGAAPVTCAEDVLEAIGYGPALRKRQEQALPADLTPDEQRLLGWMGSEPRWVGDMAQGCGLPVSEVQGLLILLEMKGLVRQVSAGQYVRERLDNKESRPAKAGGT